MKRFLVCFGVLAVCAAIPDPPVTTWQIITPGATKVITPGVTKYQIITPGAPIVEVDDTVTLDWTGTVRGVVPLPWSTSCESTHCLGPHLFYNTESSLPRYGASGQPFTYTENTTVVTGWATGALGMKLGETRRVTVPANVAYDIGVRPYWFTDGGYGATGPSAGLVTGSMEYYTSFADFKQGHLGLCDGCCGWDYCSYSDKWDVSEVEGVEVDGNHPQHSAGTCTQWTAFAPGWQAGPKVDKAGNLQGPAGSQVKRKLSGSGIAVLELEDCYGDGHVHGGLAGTGTQVFYAGQQIGPTIKGQKHTFKWEFDKPTDGGMLIIAEVHSIWKVHSFKIYRSLEFELTVLDTSKYLGSIAGADHSLRSNPDLLEANV